MRRKRTRQEKARRILEIATRRMVRQLRARGLVGLPGEEDLVRDVYERAFGIDRVSRAWDIASIVA
jgi:hypothetical protein